MKFIAQKALFASLALAAPMIVGGQAYAQAKSIAVADLEGAIVRSAAYTNANTAMQTTYKAQIDQLNARTTQLNAEIQPLATAFNTARAAPNATEASVQPSYTALEAKQRAAQAEIQRLSQPLQLSRAYIVEQIGAQLDPAVRTTMRARKIDLVLAPNAAVAFEPALDITTAVTAELNRLVPSVQIVPPAGWQPGQQQNQGTAPAAQQPQPVGR